MKHNDLTIVADIDDVSMFSDCIGVAFRFSLGFWFN